MKLYTGAALFLLLAFAPAAFAQSGVTVIGGGYGQECYEAAVSDSNPAFGIRSCNRALTAGQLSRRDRAATHVNRGILRTRMQKAESAMKDFDEAVRINPDIAEIYVNRGAALILLSRFDEAMTDLNKSLEMGTSEPKHSYYNRALAREFLGDIKGAYFDYKKALELDPEFAAAKNELKRFTVVTAPKS